MVQCGLEEIVFHSVWSGGKGRHDTPVVGLEDMWIGGGLPLADVSSHMK